MVPFITGVIRNGALLISYIAPFFLIAMGLGTIGWVAANEGPSPRVLPGLALVALGLAIAHLGARLRRRQAGSTVA
ncbi:hypothetical protein [Streptomyces sp. NPDC001948]